MNKENMITAPFMTQYEIMACLTILRVERPKRVLEYGIGGSTVIFPREHYIEEWTTLECNLEWAERIIPGLCNKVKVKVTESVNDYPNAVDGMFDLILIDDGHREDLYSNVVPNLLVSNGLCVIHDASRYDLSIKDIPEFKDFQWILPSPGEYNAGGLAIVRRV